MDTKEIKVEQRIKKGLELLPSLHRAMKSTAAARGLLMWQAVDAAFRSWIEAKPIAPLSRATQYRPGNSVLHDKLELILNSGDEETIKAVIPNIELNFNRLKPPSRKRFTGS